MKKDTSVKTAKAGSSRKNKENEDHKPTIHNDIYIFQSNVDSYISINNQEYMI